MRIFFNKLSRDMREMIPDSRSFSVTNLRYMTRFYELFPADVQMSPQIGAEMQGSVLPEILPQVGAELFGVPWEHIKLIIDKCRHDKEQAVFYVRETLKNNWSRAVLQNWLDTDLYERQGKAISNFQAALLQFLLF